MPNLSTAIKEIKFNALEAGVQVIELLGQVVGPNEDYRLGLKWFRSYWIMAQPW